MPCDFSHTVNIRKNLLKVFGVLVFGVVAFVGIVFWLAEEGSRPSYEIPLGLFGILMLFLLPAFIKGGLYSVQICDGRLSAKSPPKRIFLNIGPIFEIPVSDITAIIAKPFDCEDPLTYGVRTTNGTIHWINTYFGGKYAVSREALTEILQKLRPEIPVFASEGE